MKLAESTNGATPSVLQKMAAELNANNSVTGTYRKLVKECTDSKLQGVTNPRNRKQIIILQNKIKTKQQIRRDDIYNLCALAVEFDDFFWEIDLYPNLDAIIGLKDVLNHFDDLVTVLYDELCIILSYDTTFQLGDFYVSPISFLHLYFKRSSIVPLAFLVHDKKFKLSHT